MTRNELLEALSREFSTAVREAERPKGGQQVSPCGGDFWPVGVGVVQRFRWWAREIDRTLASPEPQLSRLEIEVIEAALVVTNFMCDGHWASSFEEAHEAVARLEAACVALRHARGENDWRD